MSQHKRPQPEAPSLPPEILHLLQAVKERPNDDTPRLVLADWLEEHGSAAERDRAEFIRLQCEINTLPFLNLRGLHLKKREARLHERHRVAWQGAVDGDWERGLYIAWMGAEHALHDLLAVPALWPWIDHLSVEAPAWEAWIGQLLESEPARWVRSLGLMVPIGDREAVQLAGSQCTSNLRDLYLSKARFGPDSWQTLLTSPHLTQLESLSLGNRDGELAWLSGLPGTPLPHSLTRLAMTYTRLGDAGAAVIASAPPLARLRHLDVQDNGLTAVGARALAASRYLCRPLDLSIRNNPIGDAGLRALLDAGLLPSPPRLDLFKTDLDADSARALADCSQIALLRELLLPFNKLPPEGAITLARSPALTGLTVLDLTYNQVGDEGARGLARSPHLRTLTRLELPHNGIGVAGALDLASADLPALTVLELAGNPLGVEGVRDFLAALALPALRELDLSGTGLGDAGAAAVATAPALTRLRVLYLKDNRISTAGAKALAESPHVDGLDRLEVWGNRIDQEGAGTLRQRLGERVIV